MRQRSSLKHTAETTRDLVVIGRKTKPLNKLNNEQKPLNCGSNEVERNVVAVLTDAAENESCYQGKVHHGAYDCSSAMCVIKLCSRKGALNLRGGAIFSCSYSCVNCPHECFL